MLHFANDVDFRGQVLTGEILDPTTPFKFSGSVTIGIATPTIGRVVLLRHIQSQGLEPETTNRLVVTSGSVILRLKAEESQSIDPSLTLRMTVYWEELTSSETTLVAVPI